MIEQRLKDNFKQFASALDGMAKKEVPFATALSLTWTAKDARDAVRARAKKAFTLRTGWVERGIQFRGARKDTLVAMVGTRDAFLVKQETGGVQRPLKSKRFALPAGVRKNKQQRITPSKRPKRLLKLKKVFITQTRGGEAIAERRGRGGKQVRVLYLLRPRTKLEPTFRFERTVTQTVGRVLSKNFGLALGRALATRKV